MQKSLSIFRFVFLASFAACTQQGSYLQDVPFTYVLQQAQDKDKPIWMMLGGGDKCTSCDVLLKEMTRKNIFRKYQDLFIFYRCNVNAPENSFLHHIFLMETVPNSYIMDNNGSMVSFQFHTKGGIKVEEQLHAYINKAPCYPAMHSQFNSHSSELLNMQNALLKGHLLFLQDSLYQALDYVESSIDTEPFFYNLYLQGKINAQLGQQHIADSCASLAANYLNNGYQKAVYSSLMGELDAGYDEKKVRTASMQLDSTLIRCGKIQLKSKRQIEFGFTNDADTPLLIYQVAASCGCSKPSWTRKPIMPNKKGSITVDYEADKVGFFNHSLQVYANTKRNPVTLFFQGEVFK